ncbi:hypothetical protein [Nonomuraea rubra]|uniref:hypothetical protein n=1 Tax=Nonomuraea rubra TaxID=46180 RepID=UPI0031EDE944
MTAATTWAAVLTGVPEPSVARLTVMSLPLTVTCSGRSGAPGLTSSTDRSLPPSEPYAAEVTTTAAPGGVPISAWACLR